MKFMIANDGPMLSTVLKVSRLIRPLLKAIIVKACEKQEYTYFMQEFITNYSSDFSANQWMKKGT